MRVDLQRVQSLIEPILNELSCDLVDVQCLTEQGRWVLRVLVDKEGGVSVGDCSRVSREVETLLEVEGVVNGPYFLEVSSPGLERPLKKESDFVKYVGRTISVRTREPVEARRNYKGDLKGVESGMIVMQIDNQEYRVPVDLVEKAHLVFN